MKHITEQDGDLESNGQWNYSTVSDFQTIQKHDHPLSGSVSEWKEMVSNEQ